MRSSTQILFSTGSFLAILFVGLIFDSAFAQTGYHLEARVQEGPPLPRLTEVFIEFGSLSTLLLSMPWFVLLGIPLVCPSSISGYRNADSFVLRYLAFLSIELFAVLLVILAMLMPFVQYYAVMRSGHQKLEDAIPFAVFVLGIFLILVTIIRAFVNRKKSTADTAEGS